MTDPKAGRNTSLGATIGLGLGLGGLAGTMSGLPGLYLSGLDGGL